MILLLFGLFVVLRHNTGPRGSTKNVGVRRIINGKEGQKDKNLVILEI